METWNVRTLLRSGALKELTEIVTSHDADVIALQELRWKGSGVLRGRKDEADLYYSCQQNSLGLGCGFAVGSRLRELIIGWNPAIERLCSIRIRGKFYNYSLICAHAPIDDSYYDVKNKFCDSLDRLYSLAHPMILKYY